MNQRFQADCEVFRATTPFDTNEHHILINVVIDTGHEIRWRIKAILDTGAPWTEISDEFLHNAGIPGDVPKNISIPEGLQTQRHGKLVLPEVGVCGQTLSNIEVKELANTTGACGALSAVWCIETTSLRVCTRFEEECAAVRGSHVFEAGQSPGHGHPDYAPAEVAPSCPRLRSQPYAGYPRAAGNGKEAEAVGQAQLRATATSRAVHSARIHSTHA